LAVLQAAYPIQTAERKTYEVDPLRNKSAFLRAFNSIVAIPGFRIVGEYHSHPYAAIPSEDDLGYIEERFDDIYKQGELLLEPSRWLEVVVKRVKKEYERPVDSGWSFSDYDRKARCVVRISPKTGFDMTFGAFWIYRKEETMRKKETSVYIPWTSSHYWT